MIPRLPFTCSIAEEIFKQHAVEGKLIMVRDDLKVYVVGRSTNKVLICSTVDQFNSMTSSKTIIFDKMWKSVATVKYEIVPSLLEMFSSVLVRHNEDAKTVLINGRNTDVQNASQELNKMISSLYVEFFPIDHLLSELLICDEASRLLTSVFKKLEIQLFWTIENANLFVFGKEVIPKDDVQMMISQTFILVSFDSLSERHFIDSKVFNDIIEKHNNTLLVTKTTKRGVTIVSSKAIVRVLLQLDHAYNETDVKSVQVGKSHNDIEDLEAKNRILENNLQTTKTQYRKALDENERLKSKSNIEPQAEVQMKPIMDKLEQQKSYTKTQDSTTQTLTVGGMSMSMEHVFTTTEGIVVKVYTGNILNLDVDCIVNAANKDLMHGGGVAAVISNAAGYDFDKECDDYVTHNGELAVGTCCSTSAGQLKYNNVIHTVGPRWNDYRYDEKKICARNLRKSIVCCFEEVERLKLQSIALPPISAGIFGVPKEVCVAEYANAVMDFSRRKFGDSSLKEIHFIDKDLGLISLIQYEFGKTFNLSANRASNGSSPSAGKPDLKRSLSSGSNSLASTKNEASFEAGSSLGSSRHNRSRNLNTSGKQILENFIVKEKMKLGVKVGDITKCEVDAIVCPQDELFSNRGAIARKVIEVAGAGFKLEVAKLKIIHKTEAQRMNAPNKCIWKYVIQTIPPRWNLEAQRENQKFENDLKETVINILNATKNSRIKTIAIPLMGIAEKRYDTQVQTFGKQFVKGLLSKVSDKDLTVEEVQIVVHDNATASTITNVLESHKNDEIVNAGSTKQRNSGEGKDDRSTDASMENEECCICLEAVTDPKKLACGHMFCTRCIEQQFKYKPCCPQCGATHGIIKGTQPKGEMGIMTWKSSLAGYEKHDTIVIDYEIYSGVQGAEHPEPGRRFEGIRRTAYLPANKKGWMISKLLKVAFERRLIFTIGTSTTTGKTGVVTWNDIHHKTNPKSGTQFGYPDPTYLDRVLEELAVKGVTEKDIKD